MSISTDAELSLLKHTVSAFRIGTNDPTIHISSTDIWRATSTPNGIATLHIEGWQTHSPTFAAYGDGAEWLSPRIADLVGVADHIPAITAVHDNVAHAQKHYGQLRLGQSHSPYHELLHAVLAQRVTSIEANRQWREIVRRFGTPAPGPHPGIIAPPSPDALSSLPYYAFHEFGIERQRADTLRLVARHFDFLSRLASDTAAPQERTAQLQSIPGVGIWTASVAGGLAFGDPDAVLVGDFHVKNTVAFALTGNIRGTDDEMVATLEPYRGQRHRVVRWLQLSGFKAPARGPRRRIVSITRL